MFSWSRCIHGAHVSRRVTGRDESRPYSRLTPARCSNAADVATCLARKRGTSKANLIRLAARRLLDQEEAGQEDPILGLIGLGHIGPGRASEEHDRILAEHGLTARS